MSGLSVVTVIVRSYIKRKEQPMRAFNGIPCCGLMRRSTTCSVYAIVAGGENELF